MTVQVRDFYSMQSSYSARHPEITVTAPNGEPVRIDVFIHDICVALWNSGIATIASCGGEPGGQRHNGAYLYLPDADSLLAALPIIRSFRPDMPEGAEELVTAWLNTPTPQSPDEEFYDSLDITEDGYWETTRRPNSPGCCIYFPHKH